ncbi:hypothetical protein RhiirA4_465672 [Rhizophagus irregularis]|uniref:Uncharacterized protein n=1 Tax=Rhizophagus irregularis TaxID=588596 RepID=A0A2I1GSK2_9GLOM|nr:hypothetical protein RhiirA4_465672 [Rhizophagus irregularis]
MEDMKKELYEVYLNLEDIGIIWNSILDEFNLKWNNINIIYRCYEQWAKNPTYIANILMLDQLTNLFVMTKGKLGLNLTNSGSPALLAPALPTYATTKTVIITTTTAVAANVSKVASTLVYAFFKFTPNLPNYNSQQGSEGTTHVLRDIKQELKQNIRTKAMTSLVRDNNVEDDNSGSKNDNR